MLDECNENARLDDACTQGDDAHSSTQTVIIDHEQRLSECSIWTMLEELYRTGGKELWEHVPFYVTSSTYIAECYAELIVAFLHDYKNCLKEQEPIYVIELGAGSGCFSYYVLKELSEKLMQFDDLAKLKLKYIMTDFSTKTISSWLACENLKPFVDSGVLDFAVFRPTEQDLLSTYGGLTVSSESVHNPIITIANYFFDSLKHDAFRIDNGQVMEVRNTFYSSSSDGNVTFDSLKKTESYENIDGRYYSDDLIDHVLHSYADLCEASILYPIGAMECLNNLRRMSNNKLVLISTDKGYTNVDQTNGFWDQPFVAHHGIFSYEVNYDAIAKYFKALGGVSFATDLRIYSVETQMSIVASDIYPGDLALTRYLFEQHVAKRNPINYLYQCQNFLSGTYATNVAKLRTYIAFIRASNCDPIAFNLCSGDLLDCLSADNDVSYTVKEELLRTLDGVERFYYHVNDRYNVLYSLGRIWYRLGYYERALSALKKVVDTNPEDAFSCYYAGACNEALGYFDCALDFYRLALTLDPECEITTKAISRMQGQLSAA